MNTLVIIKAGPTFPAVKLINGDFENWVIDACESPDAAFSVVDMIENQALPDVEKFSGVIITGSHAMVTDQESWMDKFADWIPYVLKQNIPMLGICFGHQLLAQSMGGLVTYHPGGREIGTVPITLTPEGQQDRLLGILPEVFMAHTTHAQTVRRLPVGAQLLVHNSFEAHHAWGVQFHPEFTAEIMDDYISEQTSTLLNDGYDVKAIQSAICNTTKANRLLKRFIMIVEEGVN